MGRVRVRRGRVITVVFEIGHIHVHLGFRLVEILQSLPVISLVVYYMCVMLLLICEVRRLVVASHLSRW